MQIFWTILNGTVSSSKFARNICFYRALCDSFVIYHRNPLNILAVMLRKADRLSMRWPSIARFAELPSEKLSVVAKRSPTNGQIRSYCKWGRVVPESFEVIFKTSAGLQASMSTYINIIRLPGPQFSSMEHVLCLFQGSFPRNGNETIFPVILAPHDTTRPSSFLSLLCEYSASMAAIRWPEIL
jgi:hypothetical protein